MLIGRRVMDDATIISASHTNSGVQASDKQTKHPRHVDVLVKYLGPEHGNAVQTAAVYDVTGDEQEPLDQTPASKYGSQVARCAFISQDRADLTFIVNELYQRMSNLHSRASQS